MIPIRSVHLSTTLSDTITGKATKIGSPTENNLITQTAGGDIQDAGVAVSAFELVANKGDANGYCPLDGSQLVPLANLPTEAKASFSNFTHKVVAGDITAKKVVFGAIGELAEPNSATNFRADYIGPLEKDVDFTLTTGAGAEFSWDGDALDGVIAADDLLSFSFSY